MKGFHMTTQLTDAAFVDAVVRVVNESPKRVYERRRADGIYSTCRYEYNGHPDCVIGCALVEAGVPVAELAVMEHDTAERDTYDGLIARNFLYHFGLSEGVREWAHLIQTAQDSGNEWLVALCKADHPVSGWGRPSVRELATV